MLQLLVLLGAAGLVTSTNHFMGPCRDDIEAQPDFSYEEFSKENGGVWQYAFVPDNHVFHHVHKMFLEESKTDEDGVYRSTVYERKGRDNPTVFSDQVRLDNGHGHLSGVSIKAQNQYSYTVMLYKPNEYMYFYLCSPVGGDSTTDYRFVLANGDLTNSAREAINELEEKYQFKKELRNIF